MKIFGWKIPGTKAEKIQPTSLPQPEGQKAKPEDYVIGVDENNVYIDLSFLTESDFEFEFEDIQVIQRDPIVKSYNEKMIADAMTIKQDFSWENVEDNVITFVNNLNNTLDWDILYRYVYSKKIWGFVVIQILWRAVDYEMINGTLYPAEYQMVGFRQEDVRNFTFNEDPEKGSLGDLIYTPTGENYTVKYPYNFIVYQNDKDFIDQEGKSILKELKIPVYFKNLLYKIEARYYRKAVIPAFIAIVDSLKTGADLTELLTSISAQLTNIENGAGVALSNIKDIKVLSPNNTINIDATIEAQNKVIAIRIFGTDLTMSQKNVGMASSKTGLIIVEQAVKNVALMFQKAKNDIIKLGIWNRFGFGTVAPQSIFDPTAKFDMEVLRFMANFVGQISKEAMNILLPMPKSEEDVYILPTFEKNMDEDKISVEMKPILAMKPEVKESISVEEQTANEQEADKQRKENETREK